MSNFVKKKMLYMKEETVLKTKYNGNIYMIRHIYQLQMKKTQKKDKKFAFFYDVLQMLSNIFQRIRQKIN